MSPAIAVHFRDHQEFHRAACHMTIAGALMGLLLGIGFPAGSPAALTVMAAATAWASAAPAQRTWIWLLRVVGLGVAGGAALAVLPGDLGILAFALAFGLLIVAARTSRMRFAQTVAAGVTAVLAARFVLVRLAAAQALAGWPAWCVATTAGSAFALVASLGLLPRHLEIHRDRVAQAWKEVSGRLSGEVLELANRALGVWAGVRSSLDQDAAVRQALEDAALRLLDVARRWQEVEVFGQRSSAEALSERMLAMDEKIEAAHDPVARGQYEKAKAALGEQLRYLREIATARERVVARMHHYLAAMERLRLAVLNHRSADASRLSTAVQPILEDLTRLGEDADLTSQALGEAERADS